MKQRTITIEFGALAAPIESQVREAGYAISNADARFVQRFADAVSVLSVGGYLTDAEKDRVRKRIMKRIQASLGRADGPMNLIEQTR
jgi:hypothetical protein